MTAKDHYDNHLGFFYSWMIGDFSTRSKEQQSFFEAHEILPAGNRIAVDLGCGNGIQTLALAKLGFSVTAIDFNHRLIEELRTRSTGHNIDTFEMDLLDFDKRVKQQIEVMTCMGDTITHLESKSDVKSLLAKANSAISRSGKFVLSYRDLSKQLEGNNRFIPVKSDEERILTCFLEYFDNYSLVTDLLYEKESGKWVQKVSSYKKLRISEEEMKQMLIDSGFVIDSCETMNRMIHIVGQKA